MGPVNFRGLIAKLVSFDTTSALSNLELIDFVADYLDGYDITSLKVFNNEKPKQI